jgi:hypothetical protein
MPRVGFEPTIPVFERTKTVHALDRAATVMGISVNTVQILSYESIKSQTNKMFMINWEIIIVNSRYSFDHKVKVKLSL